MLAYILRRLVLLVPTLMGLTLCTFTLVRLVPGDTVEVMMGERAVNPELHAAALHRLGLDRPLPVQYFDYVWRVLQGDFGKSFRDQSEVWHDFIAHFIPTLELSFAAMLIATLGGVSMGVWAGLRRGTWVDYVLMGKALVGYSMPIYLLGPVMTGVFAHLLGWFPVSGIINAGRFLDTVPWHGSWLLGALFSSEEGAFVDVCRHFVLPALTLATIPLAMIARMTRSAILEVLREDYIRTARAKGLHPARVVWVHVLRNAMMTVLTVLGLQAATLLAGAILTETIFSWPGVGNWLLEGFFHRDYPVVQNGILLVAASLMLVGFVVDVLYGVVNPRIRKG